MYLVRGLSSNDKSQWQEIWKSYIDFYKSSLPDAQYELTWSRLLDHEFNLHGLVIEVDGKILGLTHYSFQTSTWAVENFCYLEDLFVDSKSRGLGLGRALIDEVYKIAVNAGSSRLYWNTDIGNEAARKLYDSYVNESGKVQYRIPLT